MIGATFEGKMENGEIKGTYTQNGFPIPLTLKPGKLVVKMVLVAAFRMM